MTDLTLTIRRTLKASPEKLFNAWIDPAMMKRFMAPGPDMHVREARSEPRVGGKFYVLMVGQAEIPHSGTYLAVTPHSRLHFTWESPHSAPDTHVEILFAPVEGGTEVTLTQVKFANEGSRDSHEKGWTSILAKLDATVA